ncbi:MAG: hypothetical protein IPM79_24340 [Polyangiaceae bacterium]|nr:hypothetical protein [Polyangiaceae bacterium]MBK8940657.1 hypothetical protein [Polyangiaceae bacterium]
MTKSRKADQERPTATWREDLAEGGSSLTEEQIAAVDAILDQFVSRLEGSRDRAQILQVLHETVNALNESGGLHGRLGNFIETDEREDLVPFLLEEAKRAGLALKPGEDPTAAWREW